MSRLLDKLKEVQETKINAKVVSERVGTAYKQSQPIIQELPENTTPKVWPKVLIGLGILAVASYIFFVFADQAKSKVQLSDIKLLLAQNQKQIDMLTEQIAQHNNTANAKLKKISVELEKTNKSMNQGLDKNNLAIASVRSSVEEMKTKYNKLNNKVSNLKVEIDGLMPKATQ